MLRFVGKPNVCTSFSHAFRWSKTNKSSLDFFTTRTGRTLFLSGGNTLFERKMPQLDKFTYFTQFFWQRESLLRVSGEERSPEILISFHSSGSTSNQWRKLKNPWFPGRTLFRPSCFGTGKKKRFFAQLAHSAGPTCISYLAEEASDRLEFLPSWDSMDQDLLLLYGQYRSTLVDHMDVEKATNLDEIETSLFHFYLPSSYLCFVCSWEEFDLGIPPK